MAPDPQGRGGGSAGAGRPSSATCAPNGLCTSYSLSSDSGSLASQSQVGVVRSPSARRDGDAMAGVEQRDNQTQAEGDTLDLANLLLDLSGCVDGGALNERKGGQGAGTCASGSGCAPMCVGSRAANAVGNGQGRGGCSEEKEEDASQRRPPLHGQSMEVQVGGSGEKKREWEGAEARVYGPGSANPTGLQCYINSPLAMLRFVRPFVEKLWAAVAETGSCSLRASDPNGFCVLHALAEHFVQAGDAQPKSPLSTFHFLRNIQKIIPSLSNNERMKMQSAADFLRCLIQQLGECDCVKRATEETRHALFSPFQFTVQSAVHCMGDGRSTHVPHAPLNPNSTTSPMLDVCMARMGPLGVTSHLDLRAALHTLSVTNLSNEYNCSACNTSVKARQTSTFSTLPPFLVVNVNNYAQFGNHEVKLCKYKLQPVLFMGSLYPNDQSAWYRLIGTIEHRGESTEGGHYVACTLGPDGFWREYDDTRVTFVSLARVLGESDYAESPNILLYERGVGPAPQDAVARELACPLGPAAPTQGLTSSLWAAIRIFGQVPEFLNIITADAPCRAKYSIPVCVLHDIVRPMLLHLLWPESHPFVQLTDEMVEALRYIIAKSTDDCWDPRHMFVALVEYLATQHPCHVHCATTAPLTFYRLLVRSCVGCRRGKTTTPPCVTHGSLPLTKVLLNDQTGPGQIELGFWGQWIGTEFRRRFCRDPQCRAEWIKCESSVVGQAPPHLFFHLDHENSNHQPIDEALELDDIFEQDAHYRLSSVLFQSAPRRDDVHVVGSLPPPATEPTDLGAAAWRLPDGRWCKEEMAHDGHITRRWTTLDWVQQTEPTLAVYELEAPAGAPTPVVQAAIQPASASSTALAAAVGESGHQKLPAVESEHEQWIDLWIHSGPRLRARVAMFYTTCAARTAMETVAFMAVAQLLLAAMRTAVQTHAGCSEGIDSAMQGVTVPQTGNGSVLGGDLTINQPNFAAAPQSTAAQSTFGSVETSVEDMQGVTVGTCHGLPSTGLDLLAGMAGTPAWTGTAATMPHVANMQVDTPAAFSSALETIPMEVEGGESGPADAMLVDILPTSTSAAHVNMPLHAPVANGTHMAGSQPPVSGIVPNSININTWVGLGAPSVPSSASVGAAPSSITPVHAGLGDSVGTYGRQALDGMPAHSATSGHNDALSHCNSLVHNASGASLSAQTATTQAEGALGSHVSSSWGLEAANGSATESVAPDQRQYNNLHADQSASTPLPDASSGDMAAGACNAATSLPNQATLPVDESEKTIAAAALTDNSTANASVQGVDGRTGSAEGPAASSATPPEATFTSSPNFDATIPVGTPGDASASQVGSAAPACPPAPPTTASASVQRHIRPRCSFNVTADQFRSDYNSLFGVIAAARQALGHESRHKGDDACKRKRGPSDDEDEMRRGRRVRRKSQDWVADLDQVALLEALAMRTRATGSVISHRDVPAAADADEPKQGAKRTREDDDDDRRRPPTKRYKETVILAPLEDDDDL